jgi:hypothetical protein
MTRFKKVVTSLVLVFSLTVSQPGRADLFGGDVVVLTQILANAIQQLIQLRQILATGGDTLSLLREINEGIRNGLNAIQIINPKFNPGLYGDLDTADRVLNVINDLYGRIPQTGETRLQEAQDRSVAESIAMNGTLFRYADQTDEESKRILSHSQVVSPQGAAKLTAQSLGILIGVTTQVLRTNSMMLKMMSENMALQNRKEKIQAAQFKTQYEGLSGALGALPKETNLMPLSGGN